MLRVELYEKILASLGVSITEKGELAHADLSGKLEPLLYRGKPFYLPTKDVLSIPITESSDFLYFDVLSESVINQDSDSLKLLRSLMINKLSTSTSFLVTELIRILIDKKAIERGTAQQLSLYRLNLKVKKSTLSNLAKLIREGNDKTTTNRVINIFSKRGAEHDDVRYARLAVVDFPILKELTTTVDSIFGVEMPNVDKVAILNIYKFILGSGEDYTAGSNSHHAPGFESLVSAYANVANRLNEVNSNFKKIYIPNKRNETLESVIRIDLKWLNDMTDISQFMKDPLSLQTLPGTRGADLSGKNKDKDKDDEKTIRLDVKVDEKREEKPVEREEMIGGLTKDLRYPSNYDPEQRQPQQRQPIRSVDPIERYRNNTLQQPTRFAPTREQQFVRSQPNRNDPLARYSNPTGRVISPSVGPNTRALINQETISTRPLVRGNQYLAGRYSR